MKQLEQAIVQISSLVFAVIGILMLFQNDNIFVGLSMLISGFGLMLYDIQEQRIEGREQRIQRLDKIVKDYHAENIRAYSFITQLVKSSPEDEAMMLSNLRKSHADIERIFEHVKF